MLFGVMVIAPSAEDKLMNNKWLFYMFQIWMFFIYDVSDKLFKSIRYHIRLNSKIEISYKYVIKLFICG